MSWSSSSKPSGLTRSASSSGSQRRLTIRNCARRRAARLLTVGLVGTRVRGVAGAAVDEEDAPAGYERRAHERPELVEPFLRHVREPEREEDEVEPLGGRPLEDVGAHELGVAGVERERLRVRVHCDDAVRLPDELRVQIPVPAASSSTRPNGASASSAASASAASARQRASASGSSS